MMLGEYVRKGRSDAEVSYRDAPDGDRDGQKIRSIISVNINIHIC